MVPLLLLLVQVVASSGPAACTERDVVAMRDAQVLVQRGSEGAALARLETGASPGLCELRQVARRAMRGWSEARALAPAGGAAELLGPVRRTLEDLQASVNGSVVALEGEYAIICIRAAIAAAQDERPEMELLLTHARDLSERLAARGRPAVWPRSFNLVAGELWFEVDRYEEAVAAYDRAVRADAGALALVGLARSQARLGRIEQACTTYRQAKSVPPALRAMAAKDLSRCR